MEDILTISEIQDHFKSEWVLIEDPETTENLSITKGKVLFHSKDRDETYRKARELKPKHSAILYTGTIPDEAVVIL